MVWSAAGASLNPHAPAHCPRPSPLASPIASPAQAVPLPSSTGQDPDPDHDIHADRCFEDDPAQEEHEEQEEGEAMAMDEEEQVPPSLSPPIPPPSVLCPISHSSHTPYAAPPKLLQGWDPNPHPSPRFPI